MAKNKTAGDNRRVGAVKARSQIKNKVTGTWTKRDDATGKFMDVKADPKPFKGVRREKGK
jgi:L-arabinose isomerase